MQRIYALFIYRIAPIICLIISGFLIAKAGQGTLGIAAAALYGQQETAVLTHKTASHRDKNNYYLIRYEYAAPSTAEATMIGRQRVGAERFNALSIGDKVSIRVASGVLSGHYMPGSYGWPHARGLILGLFLAMGMYGVAGLILGHKRLRQA